MIDLLNGIAQPWWAWMGSMLWQASLLILIVTALDYILRRWAWPQVRYALWILVLVKLILPPSWTLPSSLISGWTPLARMRIEERLATPYRIPPAGETLRKPPSIPVYTATPESPYQSTDLQASQQAAQPGTISKSTPSSIGTKPCTPAGLSFKAASGKSGMRRGLFSGSSVLRPFAINRSRSIISMTIAVPSTATLPPVPNIDRTSSATLPP